MGHPEIKVSCIAVLATLGSLMSVNADAKQSQIVKKEFSLQHATPDAEGMSPIRLEALKKNLL